MRRRLLTASLLALFLFLAQACAPTSAPPAPSGVKEPVAPPPPPAEPAPAKQANPRPLPVVAVPEELPALLEQVGDGFRLTFRPNQPPEWLGPRPASSWQFYVAGKPGQWLVDLKQGKIRPADLPYLQSYFGRGAAYRLPDGQLLGISGNIQGETQIRFLIQDEVNKTQQEVGAIEGRGIIQMAPAGPSAVAYATFHPDLMLYLGSLWQYDWATGKREQIAEQGWPVGLLADGRAVAHRGERTGELIAWRAGSPAKLESISPGGVTPFGAVISPDGKRLVYFHAATGSKSSSWFGPRTASASPQRGNDRPNPTVDKVAVYDGATGKTTVHPLPVNGQVYPAGTDREGRLLFTLRTGSETALVRLMPDGTPALLLKAPGYFAGWDGEAILTSDGAGRIFRHQTTGGSAPALFADSGSGKALVSGWLYAFPGPDGLRILDANSGRWFSAPAFEAPAPLPPYYRLESFLPESGYVAVQVQVTPQVSYQILKVEPLTD